MAVGKTLRLRLFLEGIEVPVVAAQISISVNAPATASIQVVPLDEAMNLHPRTMVHLFFLDHFDKDAETGKNVDPKAERTSSSYKLLYSGEVIGFAYVQTPQSRGLVLQCVDFSSYWDAAHATAIEYGPAGNLFSNMASLYGSNASQFDDIVNQQAEKLVQWLKQKPQTKGLETVSGLAGGIIHMLEVIGGVPNHSKGINDFFTVAELRCKLLQQITAEENDNSAARLLEAKVFDQWLRNGLQNIGQQVTFRDMMKLLFQYIYYEVVPNPVAKYEPGVAKKKTVNGVQLNRHPTAIKVKADIQEIIKSLTTAVETSLSASAVRNGENILIRQEGAKRNSAKAKKAASTLKALGAAANSAVNDITKATLDLDKVASPKKNVLLTKSDPNGGVSDERLIQAAQARLREVISTLTNGADIVHSSFIVDDGPRKLSRLRTQIIRPDCWFAAPPRCNVIFPEHFTQLSYDRVFIQEVTRNLVMIYDTLIGKEHLLADRVLAPLIGASSKSLVKKTGKAAYRVLMDHELHTGIVPRSEWLPNTSSGSAQAESSDKKKLQGARVSWAVKIAQFHFFKYRFGNRTANFSGRFNPFLVCGFPGVVIKQPFIVPGISQDNVAFEKDIIEYVQKQATEHGAPQQFIGMIGTLSHNIDQNGGVSSVAMHHVRRHGGVDDEFLNLLVTKESSTKKKIIKVNLNIDNATDVRLMTILSGITPQSDGAKKKGPVATSSTTRKLDVPNQSIQNGARVNGTTSASLTSRTETAKASPPTERVQTGKIDKVGRTNVKVPHPEGKITRGKKGVFGTIIGVEVQDPTLQLVNIMKAGSPAVFAGSTGADASTQATLVTPAKKATPGKAWAYTSVTIYEEITIPIDAPLPIEEILRPSFFSNKYSNAEIGEKIYEPFFGCGSIVDEVSVNAGPAPEPEPFDGVTIEPKEKINDRIKDFSERESVKAKASIERAVNFIAYVYGAVKAQGKDVDDFVSQYVTRPIATMVDILGSGDLKLEVNGTKVKVTQGTIGFHTTAIHEDLIKKGSLTGLTDDPTTQLKRVDGGEKGSTVPPEYDVRKAKWERVHAYRVKLEKGVGLLG